MSPGSGNRQTGTIPKTKARNNCNVPQEAVTPTRRDLNNLGNIVTTSLDLVPVPEYSVNSSHNRNRASGIDDDSNHSDFADVSLVHEGGRFVPVRPQPRTAVSKSSLAHRECPVFFRYRDSFSFSEQMDESLGSPNAYFTNQNQRQNNSAAVMIVNPTTANSGTQQIQQNAENYQNANSIIVRNNSIGRTNFPPTRSLNQPRAHTARALPNNNTVIIGPSVSNTPKSSNIIHNGYNPSSLQTHTPNSTTVDQQDPRMSHAPNSVEFELGQIRSYIRATSNLVHDLRAVDNEEVRPASVQSNCSGYSENELYQNELRIKLEKSQQRIQALQDQQKQLMMCQQEAKNHLSKMNAALVNRPSQENEQSCQLNCSTLSDGILHEASTSTQNFQQVQTMSRGHPSLEMAFTSTHSYAPDFNNQQLRDFNQVNSIQSERFQRNTAQTSQGISHHEDNYAEGCQPFQDTLEQLSNKMAAIGEMIKSQGSDSEGEDDSRRTHHNVELQRKLLELQAKTLHIENMFSNYKKDQTVNVTQQASMSNDGQRKSHRSNSSSLSPIIDGNDVPHNYTYNQRNTTQSQSSDDEDSHCDNGGTVNNSIDLTSSQTAQINVMEMKLEKLKGIMQTVASIENRLATSVLDDPSYASNVQQSNNMDNLRSRSVTEDSVNQSVAEINNDCNSRIHYEDVNQKHQNFNVNLGARRYNDSTNAAVKCRNNEDQNITNEKISSSVTAMNELTEKLKQEVRDLVGQRHRLRCATARPPQYSEVREGDVPAGERKMSRDSEFNDRKRRSHPSANRTYNHSNEGTPEIQRRRQSEEQSQQSSLSVTSLSSHQLDGTSNAHSCPCQPHHGFSSEQDEEDTSTVSHANRKNNKNTSGSKGCATRGERQDRSAQCMRSPMSTPDQYKEESTYCNSAHSLDTSVVIPNASSSSNRAAYRVNRPHSKQRQQRHSCSSQVERESGAASDVSAGSVPLVPPPPMSPMAQRIHRHRWPPFFHHADNNVPVKESSCSGAETSTSLGQNNSDNHNDRTWWQQKAEQLEQQLEQSHTLCQTLLQDRRFTQHRHNEQSQTIEAAQPGAACPVPANYPGTFVLPYGAPIGGSAAGGQGGGWWALAGCYNQLNSQQWEISTLRNSLLMLEEKYLSLANLVNLRAHSTPPNIGVPDECHQAHTMRTRSALSNNNIYHNWQHQQSVPNPTQRYHANTATNDFEQSVASSVPQRNVIQDQSQNLSCHNQAYQSNNWTSHETRTQSHEPINRSTPIKIASQSIQQNLPETTYSSQNYPQNLSAEQHQLNYNLPNTTIYNNCIPLNSSQYEPHLIQNNTNPNCLLNLTSAQQSLPVNQTVPVSPVGHGTAVMDSAPSATSQLMTGQSMALNNQVPPGNRANNYWDNFRSYSRQNLLSGSSKINADSLTFSTHNPQPLVERSHNTLHSSSANNLAHNTPTNTPKRNINSASVNVSNLSHNPTSQSVIDNVRNRGRRNISQDMSAFVAPPDVLNVNQNSEMAAEMELGSLMLGDDSANRLNSSVNLNMNREYDSLQDRNINVVNPIPEILVSHTNNFLNMGGIKRKSSSKLPAKNSTSTNYSSEHIHNRNIDLTGGAEVPNLNLATASSSSSQNKSTAKLFDLLRENVYSEVTALISANESHPHFLIQLFRDLQQIRSDPLRQRMLDSIQEVSHISDFEEQVRNLPGPGRSEQAVTSSTESKQPSDDNRNPEGAPATDLCDQITNFLSCYEGSCGSEFLASLVNLIQSSCPSERVPADIVNKVTSCLSKHSNEKVSDNIESISLSILAILNTANVEKLGGSTEANRQVPNQNNSQDMAISLERPFIPTSSNEAENGNLQVGDYGEGDASLPSCSQQIDHVGQRNGSGEGVVNSHHMMEPKMDLIESAEVCNGDLAEADQSRHSENSADHSNVALSNDALLTNSDLLPDVVETEEQTPTEAEAEWLDRIPTRLQSEDGPENQSESGQGG